MPALEGRTAYVTGAGGGIGREVAQRFAEEGARVVVLDRNERAGKEVAERIGAAALFLPVDVADEASVAAAFGAACDRVGPADVLANVAGVWAGGTVIEVSVLDWQRTIAVNLGGVFLCCRAVLPDMVRRKAGTIVNIASIAALKGTKRAGGYNSSKAGVVALTKNIALDFAPYGIRANAICPGLIGGTDMELELRRFRGDSPGYEEWVLSLHPLGRLGTPGDVANAAVFLASEQASWITGTCLTVDGGCMTGY
jgi:NAD(P)-dependent dehydrogenase (short-subunit alcohol dehydrogenase family)